MKTIALFFVLIFAMPCFSMEPADHLIDIDLHSSCRITIPEQTLSIVVQTLSIEDIQECILSYINDYKGFILLARTSHSWQKFIMPILKNNQQLLPYIYKGPDIDVEYIKERIVKLLDTVITAMDNEANPEIDRSMVTRPSFPLLSHYQELAANIRHSRNVIQTLLEEHTIMLYHLLRKVITSDNSDTNFYVLIPLILFAGASDTISSKDFHMPTHYCDHLPLELAINRKNSQACKYLLEYGSSLNTPIIGNITYLAHKVVQALDDDTTLSLDYVLLYHPNPNLLDHKDNSIEDFIHGADNRSIEDRNALDEYVQFYEATYGKQSQRHDAKCSICLLQKRRLIVPGTLLTLYLIVSASLLPAHTETWPAVASLSLIIFGIVIFFWANDSHQIHHYEKRL